MTVESTMRIGADTVDIDQPCDVAKALKKMQLRLAAGGVRETVRIDGEEVTFTRGNDQRIDALIKTYEGLCARSSGTKRRTRYAKRFRFTP